MIINNQITNLKAGETIQTIETGESAIVKLCYAFYFQNTCNLLQNVQKNTMVFFLIKVTLVFYVP
jgi:hypothetical protein